MSKAILPDGTFTLNFSYGEGYLQWKGAWTDCGFPQYQVHYSAMAEEDGELHFEFDGSVEIIAYDDGKPLPSLLPENQKWYRPLDSLT